MKPVVTLLVVLGLAAGAYLLLDNPSSEDDSLPPTSDLESDTTDGGDSDAPTEDGGGKTPMLQAAPTEKPKQVPQLTQLHTPAAVLVIGMRNDQWTETLVLAFKKMKQLDFAAWYFDAGDRAAAAGKGRRLKPPSEKPDGAYFEENDIRALFLDSIDPKVLSMDCWETIAKRLRSGRMGLYIRPNFPRPLDPKGQPPAAHAALSHPVLKELLPVAKAKPLKGSPVPGVYSRQRQGFVVTDLGMRHPATRFVSDVDDSLAAWRGFTTGAGAIETQFVYPVTELKPGAQALLDLEIGDYPALVVSGAGGARVLWMGNGDFGSHKGGVHFIREKAKLQAILINQWVMWLVGQAGA